MCQQIDVTIARTAVWADGGAGGTDLAKAVVQVIEENLPTINACIPTICL